MPISLPPLRERASDVPLLAAHFIGDDGPEITDDAMEAHRRNRAGDNMTSAVLWLGADAPR